MFERCSPHSSASGFSLLPFDGGGDGSSLSQKRSRLACALNKWPSTVKRWCESEPQCYAALTASSMKASADLAIDQLVPILHKHCGHPHSITSILAHDSSSEQLAVEPLNQLALLRIARNTSNMSPDSRRSRGIKGRPIAVDSACQRGERAVRMALTIARRCAAEGQPGCGSSNGG